MAIAYIIVVILANLNKKTKGFKAK